MIVARILRGKDPIGWGSCYIVRYDGADGWFPIDSFDFNFEEDKEDDDGDNKKANPSRPGANGPGPPSMRSSALGKTPKKKGGGTDGDLARMTIQKPIDTVTCDLMKLTMQERKNKRRGRGKPKGESEIRADIHVLSTVQVDRSAEKFIYPILLIHMEAVDVLAWGVSGSGDGRPTEKLTIRYDRAAMIYVSMETKENKPGASWFHNQPRGWDQTENGDFPGIHPWPADEYQDYIPKGSTLIK